MALPVNRSLKKRNRPLADVRYASSKGVPIDEVLRQYVDRGDSEMGPPSLRSASSARNAAEGSIISSRHNVQASDSASTKQTAAAAPAVLRDDIRNSNSDVVWRELLDEGVEIMKIEERPVTVIEVGMYNARQCLRAGRLGLLTHCVEPSPANYKRAADKIGQEPKAIKDQITLYQVAAGSESGTTVKFTAGGSTGDHVGGGHIWSMTKEKAPDADSGGGGAADTSTVIDVPVMKMDDIVRIARDDVLVLKIDTQGFEPQVFSGLKESIAEHKVKYILTEYWPKGIDFISDTMDQCIAHEILENLAAAGYSLFAMPAVAHPSGPKGSTAKAVQESMPLDDLKANCRWYYDLEKRFPKDDYKVGYWTDVLAVAPNSHVPGVSDLGRKLNHAMAS